MDPNQYTSHDFLPYTDYTRPSSIPPEVQQWAEARQHIEDLDNEIANVRIDLSTAQKHAADLQNDLNQARHDASTNQQHITHLEHDLLLAQNHIQDLERNLQIQSADLIQARSDVSTKEQEVVQLREQFAQACQQIQDLRNSVQGHSQQQQQPQQQQEAHISRLQHFQYDLTQARQRIEELEDNIRTNSADLSMVRSDVSAKKQETVQLQQLLAQARKQVTDLQDDLQSRSSDLATARSAIVTREREASQLQQQVVDAHEKIKDLEDDLQNQSANLIAAQTAATASQQRQQPDITNLRSELFQARQRIRDLEDEVKTRTSELATTQTTATANQQQQQKDITRLEQELSSAKTQVADLQSQIKLHGDQKSKAVGAEEAAVEHKKSAERTVKSLEHERDAVTRKLQDKDQELIEINAKVTALQKDKETTDEAVKKHQKQREALQKQLTNDRTISQERIASLEKENQRLAHVGNQAAQQCKVFKELLIKNEKSRRYLSEQYFRQRGNYRVAVSIRSPPSALGFRGPSPPHALLSATSAFGSASSPTYRVETNRTRGGGEGRIIMLLDNNNDVLHSYPADVVMRLDASDDEKWENFELLAESAWYGSRVLFLAYGRAGTGKSRLIQMLWDRIAQTATLYHDDDEGDDDGHLHDEDHMQMQGDMAEEEEVDDLESMDDLFLNNVRNNTKKTLCISAVEIYCDKMYDLFSADSPPLNPMVVQDHQQRNNGLLDLVELTAETARRVTTQSELKEAWDLATRNRKTQKSTRNETSSRSHVIFLLQLHAGAGVGGSSVVTHQAEKPGTIMLIDLAGQQKVGRSGVVFQPSDVVEPLDPAEVTSINTSVADLGRCLKLWWEDQHQQQQHNNNNNSHKRKPSGSKSSSIQKNWIFKQSTTASPLPRVIGGFLNNLGVEISNASCCPQLQFVATVDLSTKERVKESQPTLEFVADFLKKVEHTKYSV